MKIAKKFGSAFIAPNEPGNGRPEEVDVLKSKLEPMGWPEHTYCVEFDEVTHPSDDSRDWIMTYNDYKHSTRLLLIKETTERKARMAVLDMYPHVYIVDVRETETVDGIPWAHDWHNEWWGDNSTTRRIEISDMITSWCNEIAHWVRWKLTGMA
jgi:hypothetical protein